MAPLCNATKEPSSFANAAADVVLVRASLVKVAAQPPVHLKHALSCQTLNQTNTIDFEDTVSFKDTVRQFLESDGVCMCMLLRSVGSIVGSMVRSAATLPTMMQWSDRGEE
jgi:hypothetical protein